MSASQDTKPNIEHPELMTGSGRRFRVLHSAVGSYRRRAGGTSINRRGSIVSVSDLGPGAQIDRLIELGAIAPISDGDSPEAPGCPSSAPAGSPSPSVLAPQRIPVPAAAGPSERPEEGSMRPSQAHTSSSRVGKQQ